MTDPQLRGIVRGARVRITRPAAPDDRNVLRIEDGVSPFERTVEGIVVSINDAEIPTRIGVQTTVFSDLRTSCPAAAHATTFLPITADLDVVILSVPLPGQTFVVYCAEAPWSRIRWIGDDEADALAWLSANRPDWREQGDVAIETVA